MNQLQVSQQCGQNQIFLSKGHKAGTWKELEEKKLELGWSPRELDLHLSETNKEVERKQVVLPLGAASLPLLLYLSVFVIHSRVSSGPSMGKATSCSLIPWHFVSSTMLKIHPQGNCPSCVHTALKQDVSDAAF